MKKMTTKPCNTCGIPKNLSEFHKSVDKKDGHHAKCKSCCSEYDKQTRRNTRNPVVILRMKAIQFLGGVCVRCGFSDIRALQVDHVDGGGHSERKKAGSRHIFRKILSGGIDGYQVLCANCNCIKRIENNEHRA